ncbi:coiled-coil domain-containing protein 89 [Pangasianodon hypophthalmus]|uniref:coiled-coil domain-containing protein 89 n=1 Tax=Pangasianodon hypophthalmus TaxID=310915 RepID=UPI00147A7ACF|nr:coiled-coil domain-containing protein 89 [Pangasianodon hypophthalmus]
MTSSQRNQKDVKPVIIDTKQDMDDVHQALEKLRGLSQEERTEAGMLRSRIDEQSSLICLLKQRADEMLLRCQALERVNTELQNLRVSMQTELQNEREKSEQLEQRFMDLASNHRELINFKDEYKRKNVELMKENKRLREENEKLFSKELQEKEETIRKLSQELIDLNEKHRHSEKEYQDKATVFQLKCKELMDLHQTKEASLQDKLHNTQKELKNTVDMHADVVLKLRQSQERATLKETEAEERFEALTKEKDELLELSMQRGKIIQDKQEEIQELEKKKKEAENARQEAEDRFEREAAAVNAELRVKQLQHALEKAEQTCSDLKKEFEAYKKYSSDLLAQEKELNAKLRHMIN